MRKRQQVDIYIDNVKRLEAIQRILKKRGAYVPTLPAMVNEVLTIMIPEFERRYRTRSNGR